MDHEYLPSYQQAEFFRSGNWGLEGGELSECKWPKNMKECPKYQAKYEGDLDKMEIVDNLDLRCEWHRDSYGGLKHWCYAPWKKKED